MPISENAALIICLSVIEYAVAVLAGKAPLFAVITDACTDEKQRQDSLCEYHVIDQFANICPTPVVQSTWASGRELVVHGWIYRIEDGILKDLDVCITVRKNLAGLPIMFYIEQGLSRGQKNPKSFF